jgi:integrase
MESKSLITENSLLHEYESRDQYLSGAAGDEDLPANTSITGSFWIAGASFARLQNFEGQVTFLKSGGTCADQELSTEGSSMSLAEFVQRKFIPEYVEIRRSSGRSHFRAILKHVVPPEQVAGGFEENPEKTRVRLKAIDGWPYLGSLRLCDIGEEEIQHLVSAALNAGYSIQTTTHIRNVIRAIFSHAIRTGCYAEKNPAALITLPPMARKKAHTLTPAQLKHVIQVMGYPENGIALLAILTGMNVAEICGLQWEYLNLSDKARLVDEEWIPPKTIAVRKQSYRGEFGLVTESRKRFVSVPDLLGSFLREVKNRKNFTGPQDFVFASRSGTPIHPENIAARRLKSVGRAYGMPWLSWYVFHRTHINLRSEFGRHLHKQYENLLPPLEELVIRQPQYTPGKGLSKPRL